MKNYKNNIRVIKNEENPETPEVLAESLIKIGNAMEKLSKSGGLTDEAIAVLVCNMSGMSTGNGVNKRPISKGVVLLIMKGLTRLKSYYIRK